MTPTKELNGVVSLDLTKSPTLPGNYAIIADTAKALQVVDETSLQLATQMIQGAASAISTVEAFFEGDKALAHRLHKSICDKITSITAPWRSIRPTLEPRIKAFRQEQERKRREAELRAAQEAERQRRESEEAALRIQAEADRRAAELRAAGEMSRAREVAQTAAVAAQAVVEQATAMAELGTILPDTRPTGGPGESRPWSGQVTDMKALCAAIGSGKIPLEYLMDGGSRKGETLPLVVVDQAVLTQLAKRRGAEDIGIPGAKGVQDLQLRFGAAKAAPQKVEPEW